ncbi:MAG TPA: hypothetical protein VGQ21_23035 [Thermoanaerobaculia bacterium]|jgi:hypothetical protein|nr:hypothetical protein [Thermoanaerobaculia bacterium]
MKTLLLAIALGLSTSTLFAFADLKLSVNTPTEPIHAGSQSSYQFLVQNLRGENAVNVAVNVSSTVPISCHCSVGTISTAGVTSVVVTFTAPLTPGPLTINATVSSDTADPDPSNNSASTTLTVSADPDVYIHMIAPTLQDLSVPFPVTFSFGNNGTTDAQDVVMTLDFRADAGVQSLPSNCSSPSAGRIVCQFGTVAAHASGTFAMTLITPHDYGSGSVTFTATAAERGTDFDPSNNTGVATMALFDTFLVTTTADAGPGSLRQAVIDANATCVGPMFCTIVFHIDEPSAAPWKRITLASPLPPLTASALHIDGATQTKFSGDTNPDGPEIAISGGGMVDGDGLLVATCGANIANLAIGGFLRNGISVTAPIPPCGSVYYTTELSRLFIGTDPTGSIAVPNGRGIGTSVPNGNEFNQAGVPTNIQECVISGNLHSGVFGMSGRLNISSSRIGVKAHTDQPLPNGNAGVFIGAGGYGSDVGANVLSVASNPPDFDGNVIAFNGQMGVAVAPGVADVAIRNNRIWGNGLLGIDIGLDGPTQTSGGISMPSLTLAHYDLSIGKTVIEGDSNNSAPNPFSVTIDFFANDAPDPTGLGEGQRPLGRVSAQGAAPSHFRFTVDADLTGQFISATTTRTRFVGFAKPQGIEQGFLTQTSEFSPTIEVR